LLPKRRLGGDDWYDAFALPDGRLGFSIGRIAERGVRVAGAGKMVRQSLREAAERADSPADVLERANAAIATGTDPLVATALFGTLDPPSSTVTYAVAAHPPPVLAMPGFGTEVLPAGGNRLGMTEAVGAVNWTFTLTPGSVLALHTGAEPIRSIEQAAALVLSPADEAARDFYFEFSAIPFAVPIVRHALHRYAGRLGLDDERRFALVTAVGEAMANAVEHAYDGKIGTVRLRVVSADDAFVATVEDFGHWKAARTDDERGRGLPLMRALADAVEIRVDQHCTTISLRWGPGRVTIKAR
jgi:anti-sigma regulatory factor (Ser/Thr protein kinase)